MLDDTTMSNFSAIKTLIKTQLADAVLPPTLGLTAS